MHEFQQYVPLAIGLVSPCSVGQKRDSTAFSDVTHLFRKKAKEWRTSILSRSNNTNSHADFKLPIKPLSPSVLSSLWDP